MHSTYLCAERKCYSYPYSQKRPFCKVNDYCDTVMPPKSTQFHTDCKFTNKRICYCSLYSINIPSHDQASQLLSYYYQGYTDNHILAKRKKLQFNSERRKCCPTVLDDADFTEYLSTTDIKKVQKEVEISKNMCDRCQRIIQGVRKQVKVNMLNRMTKELR